VVSKINRAYISLGSNEGERLALLKQALKLLGQNQLIAFCAVSPLYETEPVGGPPQGLFLNACCALDTTYPPAILLRHMLNVENMLGRVRQLRWGSRTLDLDLLIYNNIVMNTPSLTLPHPRLTERLFVLSPLSDIASDLVIPGSGKTVGELKASLTDGGVRLYMKEWF